MEITTAPTTAPASSPAPAAAPSSPAPAAPSSPSTQRASYGSVSKGVAESVFAQLDQQAESPAPAGDSIEQSNEQPEAIAPATPTGTPEPQPTEAQPAEAAPDAGEETLPPTLTKALQAIPDQKVARYLRDAAFMRQTIQKSGLSWDAVKQIVNDAPEIYRIAPNLDVLRGMASQVQNVDALGSAYLSGAPEGHAEFTNALLAANPENFVGYFRSLLDGSGNLVQQMRQQYGQAHADAVSSAIEEFHDNAVRNVVSGFRRRAAADPDGADAVLGEVADVLEKELSLKAPEGEAAPRRPAAMDPRDVELQRLRAENEARAQREEQNFAAHVQGTAQAQIASSLKTMLDKRASGFPPKAREKVAGEILSSLKQELENNVGVRARISQINATGKRDQAHAQSLVNELVGMANRLLGVIAPKVLREKAEEIGLGQRAREQRVAAHLDRRDPGASGLPSSPRAPLPNTGNPKDLFAALDAAAGDKPLR